MKPCSSSNANIMWKKHGRYHALSIATSKIHSGTPKKKAAAADACTCQRMVLSFIFTEKFPGNCIPYQ